MSKLLVNAPSGVQELIAVGPGGKYFDLARVLWDERTDGPMPAIQLGGMVRQGNALVVDQTLLAAAQAAAQAKEAEEVRRTENDQAVRADAILVAIAAKTKAEYDTFWAGLTAAQKDKALKLLLLDLANRA